MHRGRGVHRHARRQRNLHGSQISLGPLAVHAPGQRCVCAERLLIDEVAPAADPLPDEEPQRDKIKQRQQRHLAPFGGQPAKDKCAEDRAVDGDAALADVDHLPDALVGKGRHSHIVDAGAYDGHHSADGHHIDQPVGVNAVVHGIAEGVEHRQQHTCRDDNAVPIDIEPADGQRHPVHGQVKAQPGKLHMIDHFYLSPLYASAGSICT